MQIMLSQSGGTKYGSNGFWFSNISETFSSRLLFAEKMNLHRNCRDILYIFVMVFKIYNLSIFNAILFFVIIN